MPIYVDVITQLDARAAAVAARNIDREFGAAGLSAGKSAGKAIETELTAAGRSAGAAAGKGITDEIDKATTNAHRAMLGGFAQSGVTAGRNFGGGFSSQLSQSIPGVQRFSGMMSGYDSAAGKAGALAGRALGTAFTAAAAGVIGVGAAALFKGFERYRSLDAAKNRLEGVDKAMRATGKAGIDVKGVMDVVNKTVLDTPIALDQAMSLASRAMSSAIGPLDRFMKVAADGAVAAQSDIESVGSALIQVANEGKVSAEILNNQLRGLAIRPVLQEMFQVTGADLEKMISDGKVGLKDLMTAIETTAGDSAKNAGQTIQGAMDQVSTAVARLGANFLGAIFGDPLTEGSELVDVLGSVKDRLDGVNAWVVEHKDDIKGFFEGVAGTAETLGTAVSAVAGFLADNETAVAGLVGAFGLLKLSSIAAGFGTVGTAASGAATAIAGVSGAGGLIGAMSAFAAAAAPFIAAAAAVTGAIGAVSAVGNKLIDNSDPEQVRKEMGRRGMMPGLTGGNVDGKPRGQQGVADYNTWYPPAPMPPEPEGPAVVGPVPTGLPILDAPGLSEDEGGAKGPRLPSAPAVELDTSVPDWFTPTTAAEYATQTQYINSRQKLAEKRARLEQLEATSTATADDILNAKNDVLEADRAFQAAEMRLGEARQKQIDAQTKASEKATKKMTGLTGDLGDIGASLDQDFGISKGLAGIAENVTKFVANLAAAPLLGQLAAVNKLAPNQGGHGLMGVLGAQGVFGDQYLNNQYAQDTSGTYSQGYGVGQASSGVPGVADIDQIAARFGLTKSSGTRPGDPGYHGQGLAGDYAGPVQSMRAFAEYMNSNFGSSLKELIFDAPGFSSNVKDGKNVGKFGDFYTMGQAGDHSDHVHIAAQSAASSLESLSTAAANVAGSSLFDIIARFESGGDWSNNNTGGHMTSSGAPRGGLQITDGTWQAFGGNEFAPTANLATKQQQIEVGNRIAFTGYGNTPPQGLGAWEVVTNGSTAPYGITTNTPAPSPTSVPTYPSGSAPVAPTTGVPTYGMPGGSPGMPGQSAFGGPSPYLQNTTTIGAAAEPYAGSGSGGIGMTDGGMLDTGLSVAASGLDMLAPGAGQAAQTGIKLANRAIEYGGQVAGIGVQGLMETFLPTGGSELANNNWFTRILGGIAGAAPALPNLAGGKQPEPPLDPAMVPAGAQPVQGGDTNITVNNERATEDGTGRDIAWHQQNTNAGPGM